MESGTRLKRTVYFVKNARPEDQSPTQLYYPCNHYMEHMVSDVHCTYGSIYVYCSVLKNYQVTDSFEVKLQFVDHF